MKVKRNCFAIAGFFLFLLLVLETALIKIDNGLNQAFADKARRLEIAGKPQSFVYDHFGPPAFITHSGDPRDAPYHVLVYVPGRAIEYFTYASYAKIGIDEKTGVVRGWMINSD